MEALKVEWPSHLEGSCHLDPDFSHLTYGDTSKIASRIRQALAPGDFIAFFAAMRSIETGQLVCSLVGHYVVSVIANAADIGPLDWHRNAHTRRAPATLDGDVVVFADPRLSGRLERHIQIGDYRDRAQRVSADLLRRWGDLKTLDGMPHKDGYLQRSGAPPLFANPQRYLE